MSEATLYNWNAKYDGLDASDAKRLKSLEDENAKLKRLLADAMLDAALRSRLRDLAHQRHRFGYRRLQVLLRKDGETASRNKVYRLHRAEGVAVRKRKATRRAVSKGRAAPACRCRTRAGRSTSCTTSSPANGALER